MFNVNEVHVTLTPGQLQLDSSVVSVTGGLAFDMNGDRSATAEWFSNKCH